MFDLKFLYTREQFYAVIDAYKSATKHKLEKVKSLCQHVGNSEFCMESWRGKFLDWGAQAEAALIHRTKQAIFLPTVFGY